MAKKDSVQMLRDKIELLKGARKIIKVGRKQYLCYALMDTAINSKGKLDIALESVSDYVMDSISPSAFFDSWLRHERPYRTGSPRTYRIQSIHWRR